jgi:dTDP-4-dehydrorhamnose 3,5-epimerase
MKVIETAIPGVCIIEPEILADSRGLLAELYRADRYAEAGIASRLLQDNFSRSKRGVLRGLHLQYPRSQGKLVTVLSGAVLDVAVDVRVGSPTFAQHVKIELDDASRRQVWIPRGFAHGFVVRSEQADVFYKCDDVYSPRDQLVLKWNDPALGIDWGITAPELSQRDQNGADLAGMMSFLPSFLG